MKPSSVFCAGQPASQLANAELLLLLLSVPRLEPDPFAETKKGADCYSPAFSMRHERGRGVCCCARPLSQGTLPSSFASWRRGSRKTREPELGMLGVLGMEQHESHEPTNPRSESESIPEHGRSKAEKDSAGDAEGCERG